MSTTTVQKFYCGEVFITNTYCMILECKCCKEQFGVYSTFMEHIFEKHFEEWMENRKSKGQQMKCENVPEKTRQQVMVPTDDNEYVQIEYRKSKGEQMKCENVPEKTRQQIMSPTDDNEYVQIDSIIPNELTSDTDEDLITEILEPLKYETDELEDDIIEEDPPTKPSILSVRPVRVFPKKTLKNDAQKRYKCKICGFAVAGIYNLRGHELRHSNIKPFTCLKCNKGFYTSTELKVHTRRHNGEKPYICTYCGKSFITTSVLNKHEKEHSAARPHKCDQCEKRFNSGYQLRQHAVVHTQERNFSCDKCDAKFTRKKTLRTHMKLHDNALEYECIICHMRFNQRPTLLWHVKNKHNVMREDSDGKTADCSVQS